MLRSLLFPRRCVHCGRVESDYLCDDCFRAIQFSETQYCPAQNCETASFNGITHEGCQRGDNLDGHVSLTTYDGVMQSILEYYKRRKVTKLEPQLEKIINYYFSDPEPPFPYFNSNITIVPVPLFWIDAKVRRFNPAERLANMVASVLEVTVSENVLQKVRPTKAQKNLTRSERLHNVDHAFDIGDDCQNNDYIIVDDVWTTGATVRACARLLKEKGARNVWAISLARGI